MRVYGIDFTSTPNPRKPIPCAVCNLTSNELHIVDIELLENWQDFLSFLNHPGNWIAGIDFPFGLPEELVEELNLPRVWSDYVYILGQLTLSEFIFLLDNYRLKKPPGKKHLYRQTDRLAGALSPMMVHGIPVGRMFHAGAPLLRQSGACILPCRPNDHPQIVVEAYPALLARQVLRKLPYKNETSGEPSLQENRQKLIDGLNDPTIIHLYGFQTNLPPRLAAQCIEDSRGDRLDAVLCAVQAAWSYRQSPPRYGIPVECNPNEGWIVDPHLMQSAPAP